MVRLRAYLHIQNKNFRGQKQNYNYKKISKRKTCVGEQVQDAWRINLRKRQLNVGLCSTLVART